MRILKFGGGCLRNPQDLCQIILRIKEHITGLNLDKSTSTPKSVLVIFSAIDKTTRELELVASAYYSQNFVLANELFQEILTAHLHYASFYINSNEQRQEELQNALLEIANEFVGIIDDVPEREFEYYYDQIVCLGELLTTTLLSFLCSYYFQLEHSLVDARDFLRTNSDFSCAKVDYPLSQKLITSKLKPRLKPNMPVFIQGFIASTSENQSTTLGKEGSDFSAALFGYFLDAEGVYIYKDVPGILDADPKWYPQAQTINHLSYTQMHQIANQGARVIHHKTLEPLKEKSIPLYVVSFQNPNLAYTTINHKNSSLSTAICIRKDKQVLIKVSPDKYRDILTILQRLFKAKLSQTPISLIEWDANFCHLIMQESIAHLSLEAFSQTDYSLLSIIGDEYEGRKKYLSTLSWEKHWGEGLVHNYLVPTRYLPSLESRK